MKYIMIEIDTNGNNAHKFTNNLELYDLIIPNILCLIDNSKEAYTSKEINWLATRDSFFPNNNGHCIWIKNEGYIAAYEFEHMIILVEDNSNASTFSELCDELAELHNIQSWIEERKINKLKYG